jgi:beta-N-acetylhexosaminidase
MARTNAAREKLVQKKLDEMTLEQKIGGLVTFEFCGTRITPNEYRKILTYHCAGLRITPHIYTEEPYGNRLDPTGALVQRLSPYAPPFEYASVLTELQQIALDDRGIPLYFSADSEGDFSQDVSRGGYKLLPSAMGLAASGDDEFVYKASRNLARQQSATGVTWLHSPCLDVNINPKNPEICTRSFGDDPEAVARFGLAMINGFKDGRIVATGKHFPGRGDSAVDVHHAQDTQRADRQRLWDVELYPYRKLIPAGLPAVMTAHTIYPALDKEERPASVSRAITTDLLRGELAFEGVITTDAMGMGGVMKFFNNNYGMAAAEAVVAGADIVLCKCHAALQAEVIQWLTKYVKEGKITEEALEEHNRRVLRLKYDFGLFGKPNDPANITKVLKDPEVGRITLDAARRAAILVRDEQKLLPLKSSQKILVIDQRYAPWQNKAEDSWYHSHMLAEFVRKHAANPLAVSDYETQLEVTKEDEQEVMKLAQDVDVVVALSVYWRGNATNAELLRKLIRAGKKVALISTAPYEIVCPAEAKTLLVTFSSMPDSLRVAAEILFGKARPAGKWPLKKYRLVSGEW